MLETTNPFADPEFKKQILEDEGLEVGYAEEVAEDDDNNIDFKGLVQSAPSLPKSAKNIIADASLLAKTERDKAHQEMKLAITDIFTKYNQEYGLDLHINIDSLSESLVMVSDAEKRKILELYVSETFRSVKPILLMHLLQKLVIIMDYVLRPENLGSNQLSLPDLFLVIEKLQSYIITITEIVDSDAIAKDSAETLKKLSEEKNDSSLSAPESKAAVDEFMKLFYDENKKK